MDSVLIYQYPQSGQHDGIIIIENYLATYEINIYYI
jgi:hypothetical protein